MFRDAILLFLKIESVEKKQHIEDLNLVKMKRLFDKFG